MTCENLDAASRYAGTSQTGKTGVESSYESRPARLLRATAIIVTNARGRQMPSDTGGIARPRGDAASRRVPTIPAHNIYLSIDLELQKLATEKLRQAIEIEQTEESEEAEEIETTVGSRGAVVAIDPRTAERSLHWSVRRRFDPNLFAIGMSNDAILVRCRIRSQTGRCSIAPFNGTYPPGSTIKPMLAHRRAGDGRHQSSTRKSMCYVITSSLPNDDASLS